MPKFKIRIGLLAWLEATNMILLITLAWNKSFPKVSSNKKTVAE